MYKLFGKRIFDFFSTFPFVVVLTPLFVLIAIVIRLESKGSPFFRQIRVGRGGKEFKIWKFRTMYADSEKKGQITIGGRDPRVTKVGYYLRKYKVDELLQLWNVFSGEMSLVGPRPEVPYYTDMYSREQKRALEVKPGITDWASIEYSNESEILSQYEDPKKAYIEVVMPKKLMLAVKYTQEISFKTDLKIILNTIKKIWS